jgi:hypothetical protein
MGTSTHAADTKQTGFHGLFIVLRHKLCRKSCETPDKRAKLWRHMLQTGSISWMS